ACKKDFDDVSKIKIIFIYEDITNDDILKYTRYCMELLTKKYPSLISIIDNEIKIDNNKIIFEVLSNIEQKLLNENSKKIIKWLSEVGFDNYIIEAKINEVKRNKIKEEIENTKELIIINDEPKYKVILGEKIKSKTSAINEIMSEENNVTFEAYIFSIEEFVSNKTNFSILTLKISDKTDSIIAKYFSKNEKEFNQVVQSLKKGSWYKFRGYTKNDTYARDLVLNLRDIEEIASKDIKRTDTAKVKRVELHTHTLMSQMDGVVSATNLLKTAISWGHNALAITDHNSVQSFPEVHSFIKSYNKGKEDKDKFKVIYGVELLMSDDTINIVKKPIDSDLLNTKYCVFDFETTGFNAGSGDSIIEIGGVLIQNGEVIDTFNELINPDRKLPSKIIEITNITDTMLKGKDNEENVVKRFKDWFKDSVLVAHNATFDISFLEMAYQKYNLGPLNNAVIDTLELSRALEPDQFKHSLSALVKRYEVEFDENGHHRADYDANATAKIFNKMLKIVLKYNINNVKDLNNLIAKEEIHKYGPFYHVNILAKNRTGLKNLFKILSYANTKYLYKTPRILRSEIEKHREGLLIGSGCYESEVFSQARSISDEELINSINFYDYIEVQPKEVYNHLLQNNTFGSELELENSLKKIIDNTIAAGKIIVATGDVHHLNKEDKIYREIIVNQKVPGGGRHPLARKDISSIPDQHFRTTDEMLADFSFLDKKNAQLLVIENPNKIAEMIEYIDVIIDTKGVPFSPRIENSVEEVNKLVYGKAKELYGNDIHPLIKERIEQELAGIIKGGYDVIYLISQKLVKKSNDDGYLVGSRGSVGSSFVATLMGITEVNPLPAHYVCPKCKYTTFEDDKGIKFAIKYTSGYDLPSKKCPKCNEELNREGQDMPFATFLGFDADKVPDIDLNFSGEYQWKAHEYTKELFGIDNVYRAGTIGTVADRTAFGFVKGYCEDNNITMKAVEIERLAQGCVGVKRTTGQHPGGIVVIPDYMDVYDFTPYQYPADDETALWRTTHFDYHPMEDEILKLDILGHDDPTMLKMLQDLSLLDVTKIPFNDPEVLKILSSPEPLGVTKEQINCPTGTLGVPELGTKFVIGMLENTQPKTFADAVKISGLSHGTDVWLGNASELIKNNIVPFNEVIGCRDDIMVYLINNGVEPLKAFKIMEFVRKGKPSKDITAWKEHEKVLKDANIPDWYIESCSKIKYMFPKAHAVAYIMSAFRIAYFKVYYPIYYYSAFFSIRCHAFEVETLIKGELKIGNRILELESKGFDLTNKEAELLEVLYCALEMVVRGFEFKNIDLLKSDSKNFVIDDDKKSLIIPFRALDGLGDSAANQVIAEREKAPFISVEDVQMRGKINSTTIDKMRLLGIFNSIPESSQLSLFDL
ncbi:MAG: PolC-type DNA polymerase III, partial [Bacilli bacterium]|nr:PolC-type DNA polymerase III [Bacilli bacterium]